MVNLNEPWHIQLLGGLSARQGERTITRFRTQSTGALLAYLAHNKGKSQSREVIIELFWPDVAPEKGRHNLSNALSSLRNQLETPGVPFGAVLIADRLTVEINPAAVTTDVEVFEQALRQAARAKGSTPAAIAERVNHLTRAVDNYAGPLLPGYYDEWILGEQERLSPRFEDAVNQLARLREQQGILDAAPAHSHPVIAQDQITPESRPDEPFQPATESAHVVYGNLPLQFNRFFGRGKEIAKIQEIVLSDDASLLTLTGPGGTGKTRLAIEAAGRLMDAFAGAVWFVPLADLAEAGGITQAIADALRLPRQGNSEEPLEQITSTLAKQPSLLVLDNFEHLVDGGAEFVKTLLSCVPKLTILITSRQLMSIDGERLFPVEPLPTPSGGHGSPHELSLFESVRLFIDRAQSVKPDFQITNANAPSVAELCDRLEGIPLAIELAAARAQVLTPQQLLAMLGNRFELLVSRKRGVIARQKTLRAAIDWSFHLLDPDLQRFFAELSVFRGGWTATAAESVCEEPLALDYLAQLHECSLIRTEESGGTIRFHILETLREYAWDQLDAESRHSLRQRHAAYFQAWLERDFAAVLAAFDREQSNFREALEWGLSDSGDIEQAAKFATNLGYVWNGSFQWTEGRRRLAVVLERYAEPTEIRADLMQSAGHLDCVLANLEGARELFAASLTLFDTLNLPRKSVVSLEVMADIAHRSGDSEAAILCHEKVVDAYRETEDPREVAAALRQLGQSVTAQGDWTRAQTLYERSLAIFQELGSQRDVGYTYAYLAGLASSQRDYATARDWHRRSIAALRPLPDARLLLGHALTNVSSNLRRLGEYDEARRSAEEGLDIYRSLGDKWHITYGLAHLAEVAAAQGDNATVRACWEEALAIRRELGNPQWIGEALHGLAENSTVEGNYAEAAAYCEESMVVRRATGDPRRIIGPLFERTNVALLAGDFHYARTLLDECLTYSMSIGDDVKKNRLVGITRLQYLCDMFQRDYETARGRLMQFAVFARAAGDPYAVISVMEDAAALATAIGETETAACLLGTVDANREARHDDRTPFDLMLYDERVRACRDALGAEAFDRLRIEGRALSHEEAMQLALATSNASSRRRS